LLKTYGFGGITFLLTIPITCNVFNVVSMSFYSSSIVPMKRGGSKIVLHNVHEIVPSKPIEFHCYDGPNFLPFDQGEWDKVNNKSLRNNQRNE